MAAKCLPVMVLVGQLTSTYFSKIWFVKTFKNKIENWVFWTGLLLSLQIFILLTWLDIAESIFSLSLLFIYYLDCYILISHGTFLYQDLLSYYNFIFSEKDMLLKDLLPVHWDQKVQELTIKEKKFKFFTLSLVVKESLWFPLGVFFSGRCISLTKIL